ncbi:MAG: hypothetical protein GVY22_08350 [Gammaproteobacteria bacterium]|jgi:hypothetical protein|nr:hypothetical protein [Gammaproteobacteria bacterium]
MTVATLLHVGYHKTGSTWFQKQLYPYTQSHCYIPRRPVQEALLMERGFDFDPDRARDILTAASDSSPLIICEEELSGNPHSAGMYGAFSKVVSERLQSTFPDSEVIIFIRNQVDMTAALYRHYLREGGTHSPQRYLCPDRWRNDVRRHPFKYPVFSLGFLDYRGLTQHYRRLFGDSRVHIFAFELFRDDPRSFVAAFVERFGIKVDITRLDYRPSNQGLSRNAMVAARFLNHLTYRSVLDKRWIGPLISNKIRSNLPLWLSRSPLSGPRQSASDLLGARLVAEIEEHFATPNHELAQQTGLPLKALGYPMIA